MKEVMLEKVRKASDISLRTKAMLEGHFRQRVNIQIVFHEQFNIQLHV